MPIPEFTDAECERVGAVLTQRYGHAVTLECAESELQLHPEAETLTPCPTLYWHERGAHFVVCRVATNFYRSEFFYSEGEHYGTGIMEYVDLEQCVLTLLRVQSDHERTRAQATAQVTDPQRREYQGPEII